jgi:hypothetical protein
MVREIPLTQGYVTWVSDEDYDRVSVHRWGAVVAKSGAVAAQTKINNRNVYLHSLVMRPPSGYVVDHRNGTNPIPERPDVVDNRRDNLRVCTRLQNSRAFKSPAKGKTSAYRGVHLERRKKGKWTARICVNDRDTHLGYYVHEIDAAYAYDSAAIEYFGEFAQLNFPRGEAA